MTLAEPGFRTKGLPSIEVYRARALYQRSTRQ